MTAQYQRRLLQKEPKKKDQTGKEASLGGASGEAGNEMDAPPKKEVEKPIKMWWREVPRISVPTCVTCSATMLPRNPLASHLSMHRCQL